MLFRSYDAFHRVAETMEQQRRQGEVYPYAAFAVLRVLRDGAATVHSYEMPGPLVISAGQAAVIRQHVTTLGHAVIGQSQVRLSSGDALMLVSDGITQAGLGRGMANGWTLDGVCDYVIAELRAGSRLEEIPRRVHRQARKLWQQHGDDCTALLASCREGLIVNIFSGPPSSQQLDDEAARRFLAAEGLKIVCGATTTQIVARHLGQKVRVEQRPGSLIAPPQYFVDGIDLVTEGAVTLNQVYNIVDEDPTCFEEDSGVTSLTMMLQAADRVNFLVGVAENPAGSSMSFRQQGLVSRRKIIPLLADKLRQAGKLVVVDYV